MNIVIVNHYAGAPSLGMEFRPYYLAKGWKENGHNVIIVGGSFSHLRFKQPLVKAKTATEFINGIQYVWIKVNRYKGNGIGRILSMVQFVFGLHFYLKKALIDFKPDLIIASSTYPMDNIPLKRIANLYRAKLCYEVHDLWPLSPIELGGFSKHHPFIRMVQWAEDFAYRNVDFVISMLPLAKEYMISRGLDPKKFFYVPNGFSQEEWQVNNVELPNEHQNLLKSLRSRYRFLLGYAGGHSISNALESLVQSGSLLQEENVAIILVGDGLDKKRLQEITDRQNIENVYFLPPVSKNCIPVLLSKFDVLFIAAKHQSLYRFGISPNKMIDYMMAAKPIIQAIDAGNNMVKEYNCGISVEPENSSAITEAIIEILSMSESDRERLGLNGRQAALKFHDYKILCENFISAATEA